MSSHTNPELFELCKEVYRLTGWNEMKFFHSKYGILYITQLPSLTEGDDYSIPSYTSDYLLEKLPAGIQVHKDTDQYGAYKPVTYGVTPIGKARTSGRIRWNADTPLKALLKLTIALHEAGEIK